MSRVKIQTVQPSEIERAVAVELLAFVSDPVMRWLWPDPDEYVRQFPRFVRSFGGRAFEHGSAHVSEDFGGVALWLPVGVEVDGDAVEDLFRETTVEPVKSEVLSILEQMGSHHTPEPHWYLAVIGVDPAQQSKGIGSELLQYALAPCDEQGLFAYLESSNPANVPFYQRHGFEVVAEIQVGSSPTVRPMIRSPR